MTKKNNSQRGGNIVLSKISATFLENNILLKKFLRRFCSNTHEIEDLAQEAYLRAYVAEQNKTIEQPKAYLFRIAKNLAMTKLSKKSEQILEYLEDSGLSMVIDNRACTATTIEEIEASESLGIYCQALASLPKKCRQVFLLRKVHGLTHKEIAIRMSLSVSSVEKYLHRGLFECKAYMQTMEKPEIDDSNLHNTGEVNS